MRMITSLTLIDQALARRNLLALGLGTVVVLLSVWSGLFFCALDRKPVGQIEAAASHCRGDLAARLPKPLRR